MTNLNVRVEHIFHSGFTLETENHLLVFDYYKGNISLKDKKIIVFVSHGHEDHYTDNIFKWNKEFKDINYVLSSDIDIKTKRENIYIMKPYEELNLDNINIKSFGSTDLGLSFLVNIEDLNIFHSGDLNWWHWENDPMGEKLRMEKEFKKEINKLKDFNINIAFVPVDPRLGKAFSFAGEYFIKTIKPKHFLPMHFGDNFYISSDFINKIGHTKTHIVDVIKENQVINL